MGLYIFKSKHAPYMKVGFTSWDNPWNRVNGSADIPLGFSSVRHPESLRDRVCLEDLDLIGWWSDFTHDEEKALHLLLHRISIVGEWYSCDDLPLFMSILRASSGASKHESIRVPEAPVVLEQTAPEPPAVPNPRQGQRWTAEETHKLRSRVGQQQNEVDPVQFVKDNHEWFGRSKTALMARLKKIGKVRWQDNKAIWN